MSPFNGVPGVDCSMIASGYYWPQIERKKTVAYVEGLSWNSSSLLSKYPSKPFHPINISLNPQKGSSKSPKNIAVLVDTFGSEIRTA